MNLKKAKKIRRHYGYHPAQPREYGYDFDKTTARGVEGYTLVMARLLGQMIISKEQAAEIGVAVNDEHEFYSIKKPRVFCIGERMQYLEAKKVEKSEARYANA